MPNIFVNEQLIGMLGLCKFWKSVQRKKYPVVIRSNSYIRNSLPKSGIYRKFCCGMLAGLCGCEVILLHLEKSRALKWREYHEHFTPKP